MSLLNTEELKRQIREGKVVELSDVENEFKNLIREFIHTSS